MRRIFAAIALAASLAALSALALAAAPARAVDESKPTPPCGQQFVDRAKDAEPPNLDIVGGFYKHDAAKAAEATTINIQVSDLSTTVPEGSTFVIWALEYANPPEETVRFVRAVSDFSGLVFYEYGEQTDLGATVMNRPLGSTQGAFFEGKDGIVQIVVPQDRGGKAGTTFRGSQITTYTGAPGVAAVMTPTRGPLTEMDAAAGKGTWTAGPCAAPPSADPAPAPVPVPTPGAEERKLPVDVVTRRLARSRKPAVKLRSSEPVRDLAAQLVKGRKVVARGGLATVDGEAKLRLKATRKLSKGRYRLDLAGTTADGARRFAAAALRVR